MSPYRVLIASEVVGLLRSCSRSERQTFTRSIERLAENPHHPGDYSEQDPIGRPIHVLIAGRHAICFWADHAVKEIKIVDLKRIGR